MFIRTPSSTATSPTTRQRRRRLGVVTAIGATATVILVAAGAGTGAAGQPTRETLPPDGELFPDGDDDAPPPTISLPPHITGPIIPLPGGDDEDDDGPIYNGPIIPLPGGDEPGDSGPPLPPTDDSTAPSDPAPAPTEPATAPTEPGPGSSPSTPSDGVAPFLEIISATVDCAGVLHVSYETGAAPEPAPEAEHVVMFSPSADPTAVVAHRIAPRPINSVFTLDMQSAAPGAYRVYVVADFEPAYLDGVLLVDEADAAAPADCPAAPTTTAVPPGPTSVAPTSG